MGSRARTLGIVAGFLATACVVTASYLDKILAASWIPAGVSAHKKIVLLCLVGLGAVFTWTSIHAGRPKRSACIGVICDFLSERLPSDSRVSILARKRYCAIKRIYWRVRETCGAHRHARECLAVVGRAPIDADSADAKIKFHVYEGVAGLAWGHRLVSAKQDLPDPTLNEEEWIQTQERLGVPIEKARQVNRKCRSYVCAPIYQGPNKHRLRGVVSVDSRDPAAFSQHVVKSIERMGHTLGHLPF